MPRKKARSRRSRTQLHQSTPCSLENLRVTTQPQIVVAGKIDPRRLFQSAEQPSLLPAPKRFGQRRKQIHGTSGVHRARHGVRAVNPSFSKSAASSFGGGFGEVKSLSPRKIELAPAKKHIA